MPTHGSGIKLGITTNNPAPARLLDLTRLISRTGRGLTGVDRVELAYLRNLSQDDVACFAIVRTALGYVLLDRAGMLGLLARIEGRVDWGGPDRLSRMLRRQTPWRRRAESDLRRLALGRSRPRRLRKLLERHLPRSTAYFNTGHSNLTDRMTHALRHGLNARIIVLVHDTIPLDHPEFQRPQSVTRHRAFLRQVAEWADLVICNSEVTADGMERHLPVGTRRPPHVVAHLGVALAAPRPGDIPANMPLDAPYFVCLGTIEPRKNHALLLDLWENMAETQPGQIPTLILCGRRGWMNEDLFARLDATPLRDVSIFEVSDLSDGGVVALLQGACGLLFPSFAEGYGLPALEAAALNTPVVCNDLPVYREFLGNIPVYASVTDRYLWIKAIEDLAKPGQADRDKREAIRLPGWDQHFNVVLKMT